MPKQLLHSYQSSKAAASRPQQPSKVMRQESELERIRKELLEVQWAQRERDRQLLPSFMPTDEYSPSPLGLKAVLAKAKMEVPTIDKAKKLETLPKAKEANNAESLIISKKAAETELSSGTEKTPKPDKSSKPRKNQTEPELCEEQRALVDLILSGRNVFYTGSAGCGKSTVLKAFVKELKSQGKTVNIIAPTGRAALDINGQTFWTYAGWTPLTMKKPLTELKKAAHGKFVRERLRKTNVLVIDEISMVENHHFERLNQIMQEAREDTNAFGGVQLVVTGDFCQLPPVKPFAYCMICGRELNKKMNGNVYKCPQHGTYRGNFAQDSLLTFLVGEFMDEDKWAFRSAAWKQSNFVHVCLKTIHRQSDLKFINILEKCRMGKMLTDKDSAVLLDHKTTFDKAVKLFATREEVRRVNQAEFDRLPAEKRVFQARDVFQPTKECDPFTTAKFSRRAADGSLDQLRDHRFDATMELKEGMQVVLLVNLDINVGLVNGSQGEIVGWEKYDPKKMPKPKISLSTRTRKEYEEGSLPSLVVLSGDYTSHREENINNFILNAGTKEWPIVRFDNGLTRTIYADCTVNEIGDKAPFSLLSRTQIPLLAAWAMSIHKSQGMTLNKVIIDLSRSFEEGQMYVALSRARSLRGLRVDNLGNWRARGNEQVMQFLKEKFNLQ